MNKFLATAAIAILSVPAAALASDAYGPVGYGGTGSTGGGIVLQTTPGAYALSSALKASQLDVNVEQVGVGCLGCTERVGIVNVFAFEEGAGTAYLEGDESGKQYDTIGLAQFNADGAIIAPDAYIGFDAMSDIRGSSTMVGVGDDVYGEQNTMLGGFATGSLHQQRNLCPTGNPCDGAGFDLTTATGGSFWSDQSMAAISGDGNALSLSNFSTGTVMSVIRPAAPATTN